MASISDKVQDALDEGRILVLGTQVLVGFDFRAAFEEGFRDLPRWAQLSKLGSLASLLLALALIVFPSAWHRLVERGEDDDRVHALARAVLTLALLPFALGLALDVTVAAIPAAGERIAFAAGLAATAVAGFFWYGLEGAARARRKPETESEMEPQSEQQQLNKKIRHVLTEARTVLPGAQAMLGFQLAATLAKGFQDLPRAAKLAHLGAIGLSALTVVLLVAPAAYHRIVERGELTAHFHAVASRFVVAACVPLAGTLALDLGVVTWKLLESSGAALAAAATAFAALLGAWIAIPLAARALRQRRRAGRPAVA